MLKFNVKNKTIPQVYINIGACLDIPTGNMITGKNGETIINGGLGKVVTLVGAGNTFKSTILYYQMLSAANKIKYSTPTDMMTYDTEINISLDRLTSFAKKFENFDEGVITGQTGNDPDWGITDKSLLPAETWINDLNDYAVAKAKDKNTKTTLTAFKDPYSANALVVPTPTFAMIDSLSEFESSKTVDMLSKDLEDSSKNTYAMQQGKFKQMFMSTLPRLCNMSNTHLLATAHIGEKINMDTGPMAKYNQPTKKLQYLKQGDAVKGVSGKFFFLSNSGWYAHTASALKNQTTKQAEYPAHKDDDNASDLNVVKLTMLRSKNGASGYTIELVVSQIEGVLPTLTEFHYVKGNGRFGIEGSNISYHMVLYPDTNLSRTTVRTKINNDPLLRRAINITSELLQLNTFHPRYREQGLLCTPEELYKDIKALGYDWNVLLQTREFWIPDQYCTTVKPFLSVMDLLKMRRELYTPYWMDSDKKIKKAYAKLFNGYEDGK